MVGGTPLSRPGMGYPPVQTWDGVPPIQTLDGIPPISWMGYPPKVEQTHTCENITSRCTTYAGGKNSNDQVQKERILCVSFGGIKYTVSIATKSFMENRMCTGVIYIFMKNSLRECIVSVFFNVKNLPK